MGTKIFIRFLAVFYLCVFVGLGILFFNFLGQNYREMESLRAREAHLERMVELREQELERKTETARRLREDPEYLERVIRQQLGYIGPGEFLFRFEEDDEFFRF
ncbi:MAG: septum formation initiator family protein [Opitutales bacterium]|nr:septum formation initiator family protein [Opitutales bacterium]MCH8541868.1 septum formation initiator family protein [Opitutales bacterium]